VALALHPEAPELHYVLGALLGSADDHLGAIDAFQRELAREPAHSESHRGLGTALSRLGRPQEAIRHFQRYFELGGDDARVRLQLARELIRAGEPQAAEAHLDEASRVGLAEAEIERGLLRRAAGDLKASAAAFRRALLDDPGNPTALFNLGQVLLRQGLGEAGRAVLARHAAAAKHRDRIDYLERSSRLTGATAANFVALGAEHLRSGDRPAAVASFREAARRAPGDPEIALTLAATLLESGGLDEARGWAVRALLAAPANARAHFILGLIRLRGGDADAARASFDRSRELAEWGFDEHRLAAEAHLAAGAPGEAARAFAIALEIMPSAPAATLGLVRARLEEGDWAGAEAAVTPLTEEGAENGEAHALRAIASAGAGRTEAAGAALVRYLAAERATLAISGPEALLANFSRLPRADKATPLLLELLSAPAGGAPAD
jgi:tetratricopeptide (TPR) repeat protein